MVYLAVMTGFETENKYLVRNTLGQQVYFAAERKNVFIIIIVVIVVVIIIIIIKVFFLFERVASVLVIVVVVIVVNIRVVFDNTGKQKESFLLVINEFI